MAKVKSLLRKFVPESALGWYHFLWAFLGAALYGFPAYKMTVVGVTGTDGKSTTTEMITRIFTEAGYKTCSTSSVWFQIGGKREKNHLKMGMPGRMFLQKFLRQAAKQGCTHAVIEVSSEGILQNRHRFLNFHTGVITNVSPEHIERHGSFEKYRAEKQKLFRVAKKVHILNADDENAQYFSQLPAKQKVFYGIEKRANYQASNVQENKTGTDFHVNGTELHVNLIGRFNAYNALAAVSVGSAHGISIDVCKQALANMPAMPGRTDVVVKEPFTVLIDYAVTPK
ncbi:MAG TPA: Mur ligase family protein, partial [Candidatus Paceibacterota bacterium]